MALSPEERQRIYEEEKARLETRQQLEAEQKAALEAEQKAARDRIEAEEKAKAFYDRDIFKPVVGCLVVIGVLVLWLSLWSRYSYRASWGTSSSRQEVDPDSFLAEQLNRNRETIRALERARDSGDRAAGIRVLKVRIGELESAIRKVESGSFSASDKARVLKPLQEELTWAVSSAAAMERLR